MMYFEFDNLCDSDDPAAEVLRVKVPERFIAGNRLSTVVTAQIDTGEVVRRAQWIRDNFADKSCRH